MAVHDSQHLFANVLRASETPSLDEVFKAPRVGKLVVLPGVVDGQQGQVIPLRLVELCLALVRHCLLVLGGGGGGGEEKLDQNALL